MSDFIAIDIAGIEGIQASLKHLPPEAQEAVTDDVSTYLINVLKLYPPYRYVSRRSAYGFPFFTDKQRRWFFWALGTGELKIGNTRTQTLAKGWKKIGSGANVIVANETPYAAFVMGEGEQSRHEAKVGWKTLDTVVSERASRIIEIADAAIKKALKKLGL